MLPIFRSYWCFHAVEDSQAAQKLAAEVSRLDWRAGVNIEERLSILGAKISTSVWLLLLNAAAPVPTPWS